MNILLSFWLQRCVVVKTHLNHCHHETTLQTTATNLPSISKNQVTDLNGKEVTLDFTYQIVIKLQTQMTKQCRLTFHGSSLSSHKLK